MRYLSQLYLSHIPGTSEYSEEQYTVNEQILAHLHAAMFGFVRCYDHYPNLPFTPKDFWIRMIWLGKSKFLANSATSNSFGLGHTVQATLCEISAIIVVDAHVLKHNAGFGA